MQLYEVHRLLSDIRFLKNNDTEIASDVPNENTALQESYETIMASKKDGQAAFNNTASLETLLKKVCVFEKDADNQDKFKEINPDFLTFLTGQDAKLKTLTDLFQEKDPQAKHERYLKFAWSEKGGQQKIDSKDKLEDDEKDKFSEYLYECAIGKINENALTKPSEEQEDNPSPTPTEEKAEPTENVVEDAEKDDE
ncbi:13162_t:CDS:2 [Entrophospora sp. SA101]|nr:3909_t:CDS:2 [Entrophospora sp. SA101]CAJ0761253.1 13162_t:CDS:2 [Entrophospora sp. SA101]CAJ0851642.1 801_t:CDS:2 [Entrophospora sp. SA101]